MTMHRLFSLLFVAVAMPYVLFQVRKPGRWVGQIFARLMNRSHSGLTNWGLSHLRIEKQFTILDVGCGGGATVGKLAAIAPEGVVHGIDYSAGSAAVASSVNRDLIKNGRVNIQQASVSNLPFPDSSFDLVTAVETQYYWPNLVEDMREIRRVLKPGAALMILAESYQGGRTDKWQRPIMKLLGAAHLDVAAHRQLLGSAGYDQVEIFENPKGWICAVGRNPLRNDERSKREVNVRD